MHMRSGLGNLPEMLRVATNLKYFNLEFLNSKDVDLYEIGILMRSLAKARHLLRCEFNFDKSANMNRSAITLLLLKLRYLNRTVHLTVDLFYATLNDSMALILRKSLAQLPQLKTLAIHFNDEQELLDIIFDYGRLFEKLNHLEELSLDGEVYSNSDCVYPYAWKKPETMRFLKKFHLNEISLTKVCKILPSLPNLKEVCIEFQE